MSLQRRGSNCKPIDFVVCLYILYSMSRSDAETRSDDNISSHQFDRNLFFKILSLLRARSADALDIAKQQKMVYNINQFISHITSCSCASSQ